MNTVQWNQVLTIFLGTVPLLGAVLWNLIDVRGIRSELHQLRTELHQLRTDMNQQLTAIRADISAIKPDIASLRERVATLEERDRLTHPPLVR